MYKFVNQSVKVKGSLTLQEVVSGVACEFILGLGDHLLAFVLRLQLVEVLRQLVGTETGDLVTRHEGLQHNPLTLHHVLEPAQGQRSHEGQDTQRQHFSTQVIEIFNLQC